MKTSFFNEFLALSEQLNFSRAAQKLGMNQSVLSRHIKQLEEELGVPLFTRTTQKMELTLYGAALIPHAREILAETEQYALEAENIRRDADNRISLGVCGFPAFYGITALFADFKNTYPDAVIDVHTDNFEEAFQYLDAGNYDAIFVHNAGELYEKYDVIPFCDDYFSASFPAAHPMADRESVHLSELKDETFYIRHKKNSYMYNLELQTLRNAGFEPKLSLNQNSREDSIINFTNGISLVTQGLADRLKHQVLVRVVDISPRIHTNISLIYLKDRALSNIAQTFLQFAVAHRPGTAPFSEG